VPIWTARLHPECGVLPVGPAGIGTGGASRTRIPRGLSSRGLPVASLPRAPPEARTPFPGVRAQCITRHACGARSGPPRIRTGKPPPCQGVALPIGASSPRGCLLSGDRQPGQAFPGRASTAGKSARLVQLRSAVQLSMRRHVHSSDGASHGREIEPSICPCT
jgi:hypothetical protein